MKILGVDPGVHGGAAIVHITDGEAPRLLDAIYLPVVEVGAKGRINVPALRDWIRVYQPDHAAIQRAQEITDAPRPRSLL
jgi:hypothetical protein